MFQRIFLIAIILTLLVSSFAYAQEPSKDMIQIYTTWDEAYIYYAFKIDTPNIQATHKAPNEDIGDDDSVTIYLEADNKKSDTITSKCYAMKISAAGGCQFLAGDDKGSLLPVNAYTFKFGVNLTGTPNNDDDIDQGFSIEAAIPWQLINMKPPTLSAQLTTNAIIRTHSMKAGSFVSISPNVISDADINIPAKWSNLVLTQYTFAIATVSRDKILSAKYIARAPSINGQVADTEWNKKTAFSIDLPQAQATDFEIKFPKHKLVFADYSFDFQLNKRKSEPYSSFDTAKIDTMPIGTGPWFSYDRVQWHKDNLMEMAKCGIDVAFINNASAKGLDCLVAALDELRIENKSYPLLAAQDSSMVDRIPVEYKVSFQAGDGYLINNPKILGFDKTISSSSFNAAITSTVGDEIHKYDTAEFSNMWADALNDKWILIDSWNNIQKNNHIFPSKNYGSTYADISSENIKKFKGSADFDSQYLRFNIPANLPLKQISQAEVLVKNIGTKSWAASDGYAIGYRWYINGRFYSEGRVKRPIQKDIKPGESAVLTVGIIPVDNNGADLPEGKAVLRIEMLNTTSNRWFSNFGDQSLMVPVTIGSGSEYGVTYLTQRMPSMMAVGKPYQAYVRVRNDGSKTWKSGSSKLIIKLFKADSEINISPINVLLNKKCEPGQIADFAFSINIVGKDKKPIAGLIPGSDYHISLDIFDGESLLSEKEVPTANRGLSIFEKDYMAKLVDCDLKNEQIAGSTVETKVILRNNSSLSWDKKRVMLGCHWYKTDGAEVVWDGQKFPLLTNIQPSWPVMLKAKLDMPKEPGDYVLVWDVFLDGKYLSSEPITRGGDMLTVPVKII